MSSVGGERTILSRLRRGTIESFALHVAGFGLLFLMHTVLGRATGPKDYGTFSYALTLAGVMAVLVPLGWPTAVMRFVAQYVEQQHWGLMRGVLRRSYQITFLFAILAALALWTISYWNGLSTELTTSLRFAALLLLPLSFVSLRRKALQGLQRVKSSIIPEEVVLPLLVIFGVYLFSVTTALSALLTYAGAAMAVFLLGNVLLWRNIPIEGRTAKPEFKTYTWMAVALPMVFGGFSQVIMNRTDVLMLGILTDMQSVGLYSAATRIAILNTLVLGAVNTLAAPMISAEFHGGRTQQVGRIMRSTMLLSTIGTLPIFVFTIVAPQFLLGLFGAEFTEGGNLLRILALGQFVNAVTGPVGFVLLMTGRERTFAWTLGAAGLGNVVGNLIAIPVYGAIGAAVITAMSIAALNCSQFLLAWKANANLIAGGHG